jgi:hypothetical protein
MLAQPREQRRLGWELLQQAGDRRGVLDGLGLLEGVAGEPTKGPLWILLRAILDDERQKLEGEPERDLAAVLADVVGSRERHREPTTLEGVFKLAERSPPTRTHTNVCSHAPSPSAFVDLADEPLPTQVRSATSQDASG